MGWERRRGTAHRYYTRTERLGNSRRRIYFGSGPLAEIAAVQDSLLRVERELRRREERDHPATSEPSAAGQDGDDLSGSASADAVGARSVTTGPGTPDANRRAATPTPLGPDAGPADDEEEYGGPLARLAAEIEAEARAEREATGTESVVDATDPPAAARGDADAGTAERGPDGSATAGAAGEPAGVGGEARPARGKSNSKKRSNKRTGSAEGVMEYISYTSATHAETFELASKDEGRWQPEERIALASIVDVIHRDGPQRGDHRGVAFYQQGDFLFWIRGTRTGLGICLSVSPSFDCSGQIGERAKPDRPAEPPAAAPAAQPSDGMSNTAGADALGAGGVGTGPETPARVRAGSPSRFQTPAGPGASPGEGNESEYAGPPARSAAEIEAAARAEPETPVSEPVEDSRDTAAARADAAAGAPGDGRVGSATKCAAGDAPAIGGIASPVRGHVDSKKRNQRHKGSGDRVLAFANTSATHSGASEFASADDRRWQPEVYLATASLAGGILRVVPSGNVRP